MNYVYIINGLPASGKSTVARELAKSLNLPLFTKDDFKERMGDKLEVISIEDSMKLGAVAFSLLYYALKSELKAGKSCIIEANFNREFDHDQLVAICGEFSADPIEIYCHCDNDVRKKRHLERLQSGNRHSVHLDDRRDLPQLTPDLEPLAFNKNIFKLDTTNGYEFGFTELLAWLKDQRFHP